MDDQDKVKLREFLNSLLEAERAGAKAATVFHREYSGGPAEQLIAKVRKDEAWCCGMLSGWIERLAGKPSQTTGSFFEKVLAKPDLYARLSFLNRGQCWVVDRLEEIIPRLAPGEMRTDLAHMLEIHKENIKECAVFLSGRSEDR